MKGPILDATAIWLAYNSAENAGDFEGMGALVSADLEVAVNGHPALGSAHDDLEAMHGLRAVYPDYRRQVDETLAFGDRVVVRWRMSGASDRPDVPDLDVAGCSVVTVANGVLSSAYLYYDGAALDAVLEAAAKERS
ncbi:nuclear transport factor 2 family protein [Amycolatopsis sp. FU40]|uniref:nuclear transport factor 2 family protein n=1 Tax=Amycolatopsis sp. FU40 TaxID=2914159 RepID=UPI001F3AF950|nr:nuclear transport factor 2 family protein [Amycolatopsis sp. FU40]UKD57060.1 nuclear transport factor 2 family protein [Amycolatopsis sp. FU40]